MADGKPKLEEPTVAVPPPRPTVSGIRRATIVGDQIVDMSAASLAGTIALGDTVLTSEGVATVSGEDRYVPIRELGRGGMGRVDVMFDRALGRPVARKMVLAGRHAALLVAEAQICAQLEHPSIVPVYDVGVDAQHNPHYTMRVFRGRTLRDVLDDNTHPDKPHLGLTQLLGVLRQICLAVDYAHSRGVIHRDLKPENVVLGEFGEVYVLDWGVAYVTEDSDIHRATPTGELTVAGSPGYMAPEQALGERIDARTDVFALGVMLYEILSGRRPFEDRDLPSILKRISRAGHPPPSRMAAPGVVPAVFDDLVHACLARDPGGRPPSARFVADAIDGFLDGERARLEREHEAAEHAAEGAKAREACEALDAEARRLREAAETMLAAVRPWEAHERKQPAWEMAQEARGLAAEAARAIARAEAAFARALGRVPDHAEARAGLAALHFRQFEAAETAGDAEKMAQYRDLARTYDDGALGLELADQGSLVVESVPPGAEVTLAAYESVGLLQRERAPRALGQTPTSPCLLHSGSYLVAVRAGARTIRYPLVIERAKVHRLRVSVRLGDSVPPGMVPVPGGPFLALAPRASRPTTEALGSFAVSVFPVTLREYVRFLDALSEAERHRRTPGFVAVGPLTMRTADGKWAVSPACVEGPARERLPPGRELDLPAHEVSWFDALAYARWLAASTGLPYRLPTDLEWEKAMRGADGRAFPMGNQLDASFAKLRESRPEAAQPEPVGAFPIDESPYGVRDLAGGVGDWTSTSVDGAPLPDLSEEGTPAADERQAYWRGGTWGTTAAVRGMRYQMALRNRTSGVGFRLALSLDDVDSGLVIEPMPRAPR